MDYLFNQLRIINLLSIVGSVRPFRDRSKRCDIRLLAETVAVVIVAILAIKIFRTTRPFAAQWFMTPAILVSAALIPTIVKKRKFSELGLTSGQIKPSLVLLSWSCFAVFPAMFCALWLLRSYGFNLPLRPVLPQGQGVMSWIFYQFMYVAVAEEIFFRGFLQSNLLRSMKPLMAKPHMLQCWISIVISAACFAIAHTIVQGQIIYALTFLPGLLLGWLFIRSKSLLVPIVFHGIANTSYYFVAEMLSN